MVTKINFNPAMNVKIYWSNELYATVVLCFRNKSQIVRLQCLANDLFNFLQSSGQKSQPISVDFGRKYAHFVNVTD